MQKVYIVRNNKVKDDDVIAKITSFLTTYNTKIIILDEKNFNEDAFLDFEIVLFLNKTILINSILDKNLNIICFIDGQQLETSAISNILFYDINSPIEKLKDIFEQLFLIEKNPISLKLDEILADLSFELRELKKIHKEVVPMRELSFKHINASSKYSPGVKSGGDFFEFIECADRVVVFLFSSKNYTVSSLIMALHEKFRTQLHYTKEEIVKFVHNIISTLQENKLNPAIVFPDLALLTIDPISLCVEGISIGDIEIVTGHNYFYGTSIELLAKNIKKNYLTFKLKRGEKVMLLTPGVRVNSKGILGENDLIKMIKNRLEYSSRELLNEIFYYLKINMREGGFLEFDSTAIVLEAAKKELKEV